jgi:hypothetical protein
MYVIDGTEDYSIILSCVPLEIDGLFVKCHTNTRVLPPNVNQLIGFEKFIHKNLTRNQCFFWRFLHLIEHFWEKFRVAPKHRR